MLEADSYQVSRRRRCWRCLGVVVVELQVVDERLSEQLTEVSDEA